jgi:D-alanyl-D-alanine dipeptidase
MRPRRTLPTPLAAALFAALLALGCATSGPIPSSAQPTAPASSAARPVAATSANADSVRLGTAAEAESLLVDVRAVEPTILVEARYATADNFTGAPLPGYEAGRALVRREAGAALARVQQRLRAQGLGLKVFDAYRPVRATLAMVDWTRRVGREDLVRDGYIASRSRHNLGLAIDLTLVALGSGRELDMGTPFDTFAAAAHTANASGDVAANRRWLVEAMEAEGFVNYDQEWWHFSYSVPDPLRFDVVIR